ncbi:hypothetical protein F7018_09985 [Tenacibaculum aiptasiae]|uniref:Uncharacterized protein n=1 Tax=Tenacibaculum aiptasiae TaxID=426481 RepID=A0A7J5AIC1_9FLAO|nr:hypothetical protein [Tenacibaculum aiptasiae]KAB1157253.1 hypothetical protein F7018_09985 [Tenacibaculum aiptasiae]
MLFNITYTDKDDLAEINSLVGKPISFIQSLRLRGVGSGRMIVEEVSANLQKILTKVNELDYGSIELRPNGVIVYITKQMRRFCLVVPYYKLVVFNDTFFSIHSDNSFIRFRKDIKFKENKKFIDKMMNLKGVKTQNHFL